MEASAGGQADLRQGTTIVDRSFSSAQVLISQSNGYGGDVLERGRETGRVSGELRD